MLSASLVPSLELSTLEPLTHSVNNHLLKICSRHWCRRKYKYEKSFSSENFQYRVANKKSMLTKQNPCNIICLRIQSLLVCRPVNLINRLFPIVSHTPFIHILAQHLETQPTLPTPKVKRSFFTLTSSCRKKLHKEPYCPYASKSAGPSESFQNISCPYFVAGPTLHRDHSLLSSDGPVNNLPSSL